MAGFLNDVEAFYKKIEDEGILCKDPSSEAHNKLCRKVESFATLCVLVCYIFCYRVSEMGQSGRHEERGQTGEIFIQR